MFHQVQGKSEGAGSFDSVTTQAEKQNCEKMASGAGYPPAEACSSICEINSLSNASFWPPLAKARVRAANSSPQGSMHTPLQLKSLQHTVNFKRENGASLRVTDNRTNVIYLCTVIDVSHIENA